jgi:hypothetical protein
MKKLFVSLLAVAALAACTNEQTLVQRGNAPMEFNVAALDNVTRVDPSITSTSLSAFDVWAYVDQKDGTVLTEERVSRQGDENVWFYTNKQYWTAGHTYYFAAIAPVDTDIFTNNWTYNQAGDTIAFTNVDGTEDLIYAQTTVATPAKIVTVSPVGLEFNHLLSKVKFTFKNGFSTDNVYIAVEDVEMVVPAAGTYTTTTGAWALENGTTTLAFGNVVKMSTLESAVAADERFTIPASEQELYTISFKVKHYNGEVLVGTYDKIATITGVKFEKGKAYNLTAEISPVNLELAAIEFELNEVNGWVDGVDADFLPSTPVATAEELVAALAAGSNVTLTQDINLDSVATRAELQAGLVVNKDFTLDGNGYTVTTTAKRALQFIEGAKNVTIKNLTLNAPNSERGFQFQADGHKVVIENVTATSGNYTVYLTATSTNSNVLVKNCDLTGKNTISVCGENHQVNVENTKITTIDNNAAEAYASIYNNAENTTVYVKGGEVVITGSANDSFGGVVIASGASIIFNGTEGTTTIEGQPFVINYDNGYTYSFSTFAEAVETAKDGDTIQLLNHATLADAVTINKNVNLNLNGYTLTVAQSNFVNEATLVVSNGTISGSNTQVGRRAIVNKGNLTMNDVTVAQVYEAGGSAINNDGANAVAVLNNVTVNAQNMAVSNKNGAKMTINGGNFVGNGTGKSYAIVNQLGSTMTINGGTFEGGHGVVSSTEASETTLNGGTYHCTCTCTGNSDWVLYTSYASGEEEPGYIRYNEANCTFTTVRTDGTIYYSACESQITKL